MNAYTYELLPISLQWAARTTAGTFFAIRSSGAAQFRGAVRHFSRTVVESYTLTGTTDLSSTVHQGRNKAHPHPLTTLVLVAPSADISNGMQAKRASLMSCHTFHVQSYCVSKSLKATPIVRIMCYR